MSTRKPWEDEPDHGVWLAHGSNFPCAFTRNGVGALCGYVGVPDDHPWHGKQYHDYVPSGDSLERNASLSEVGVITLFMDAIDKNRPAGYSSIALVTRSHGGLTYSGPTCPGKRDDARSTWWFGFDCAHAGDLVPGMDDLFTRITGDVSVYRTAEFVRLTCEQLAEDLASVYPNAEKLELVKDVR